MYKHSISSLVFFCPCWQWKRNSAIHLKISVIRKKLIRTHQQDSVTFQVKYFFRDRCEVAAPPFEVTWGLTDRRLDTANKEVKERRQWIFAIYQWDNKTWDQYTVLTFVRPKIYAIFSYTTLETRAFSFYLSLTRESNDGERLQRFRSILTCS